MISKEHLEQLRALIEAILDERGIKRVPSDITEKRRRAAQVRWERQRAQRNGTQHDAHAMQSASTGKPRKLNGSHAHAMQTSIGEGDIIVTMPSLKGEVEVRASFCRELIDAYPAVLVAQEMDRAKLWCEANPAKRKTNIRRFLTTWMARCQERGGSK